MTVIIGSAMDIVTYCNVPRYLHNNIPLGNPLGPPEDRTTQQYSIERALQLAVESTSPVVETTDLIWPGAADWPQVYGRVTDENRALLLKLGAENRRQRAANKAKGLAR